MPLARTTRILLPALCAAACLAAAGCSWHTRYGRMLRAPHAPISDGALRISATPAPAVSPENAPSAMAPRAGFIAPSGPLAPEQERASFAVPPGFEVQLVASEPAISKPMQLAFDERGRLLVTTSIEYPLGAKDRPPADRVMAIAIDGQTGAATKVQTFAGGFDICSGIEALPGGRAIVGNAPDIVLLHDVDGDGAAEHREVLYTGFARSDTHELPNSFTWGIDGWLYGLQGHVNESKVKDRRGEVTLINHANVYRMKPDGARVDVFARGMSNPWGLAFDLHHDLYAADCESRPIWHIVQGLPYQGFLQEEEALGFAPTVTEDPHGASGFAGLVSYTAEAFPREYWDCLFLGNPVTGRIHRDRITFVGSTHPMQREPDFLTSTDPWFRPVDIELGPDGALYVADWYNKIIAHVEVPLDHPQRDKSRGRIWRIVYRGSGTDGEQRQFDGPMARDWGRADLHELLGGLRESNAWVRRQASMQLRARYPQEAVAACRRLLVADPLGSPRRMEAFHLLLDSNSFAIDEIAALLNDPDPWLRRAAVHALGEGGNEASAPHRRALLMAKLNDPAPHVVREAVMALRGMASADSFWRALDTARNAPKPDALLRYACTFSAREQLACANIIDAVAAQPVPANVQRRFIDVLAATSGEKAAGLLHEKMRQGQVAADQMEKVLASIIRYGSADTLRAVLDAAQTAESQEAKAAYAAAVFRHAKRARRLGADPFPFLRAWCGEVAASHAAPSSLALSIAAEMNIAEAKPIAEIALQNATAPAQDRGRAAKLLFALEPQAAFPRVVQLLSDASGNPAARKELARECAKHIDTQAEFDALLAAMKTATAEVYAGVIENLAPRKPAVNFLLDAVEAGRMSAAHINNHVTRIRIRESLRDPALDARFERITSGTFSAEDEGQTIALAKHLRERFEQNPKRDIAKGQAVFEENCMVCHRIGGVGTLKGPNLDGAGNRGLERILQDVTMPNQDVDPAFRATMIVLDEGDVLDGLVVGETPAQLVLSDSQSRNTTIAKDRIASRRILPLSPMPAGFGTMFPEDRFLDLLGFLLHPPAKIEPITVKGKSFIP